MKLISKVQADESKLIHSDMPEGLTAIDDSTIACIADQRVIALYHSKTGALLDIYDCDTLIRQSGFKTEDMVRRYFKDRYPGRAYIDDTAILNHQERPKYLIETIAGPPHKDSLFLSVNVSVTYIASMFILGKVRDVHVLDNTTVLFSLDLKAHRIHYMNYIEQHDFDTANDRSIYLSTSYGACYQSGIFYAHLGPNRDRVQPIPHFLMFNCNNSTITYADVHTPYTGRNPRFSNSTSFVPIDSQILFNTYWEIYRIDKEQQQYLLIALKDSFDTDFSEHIVVMGRLEPDLLLVETLSSAPFKNTDSVRQYYQGYYLLDLSSGTLSRRIGHYTDKNRSSSTAFMLHQFIKFSRDEEHYYIETYQLQPH